jgi:predicted ATP-grasp superfamily ATP-dependent carboligase
LLALLPETERLPDGLIPFPPLEIFRKVSNKSEVTALAATLGISIPEQVVLTEKSPSQIAAVDGLSFPLVLKPARSVAGEAAARTKMSVTYVDTRADFDRQIAAMPSTTFPLLVQRRIEGPGTGVFLLRWGGEIIAQFAHRRIREKPPSGGVSVCAESIEADPVAVERSAALLAALDWSGPAMVEYKQDEATGRLYLMEINGRFWGSLQLAVDAGVDFPALLVAAARGEHPTPVTDYKVGVQTHWWWGEVDHLIARVKRPHETPALGGRSRAIWRFLFPGRGLKNEVFRLNDMRPSVYETLNWFRGR